MALTRVSRHIIDEPLELQNINATGIGTFASLRVTGDLQVDGTTTTLDTVVTEVDRLEVSANNSTVGAAITQSGSGDILRLYDGSTEVFTVTDGGKVGIGTDNPGFDFHLFRTGDTTLVIESDRPNADENANPKIVLKQDGGVSASAIGMNFDSDGIGNDLFIANSITSGSIRFLTGSSNGYTNASERLRITSGGNIGIGTVTPLALYRSLSIHGPANDQGGVLDLATKDLSSRGYVFNDSNGLFVQTATNHHIILRTNNTERLRIDSSGNVRVPDGGKFTCGASDDLEVYHNGNDSAINDKGTGNLYIQGSSNIYIRDYDTSESHIIMIKNNRVELYYDGSKKFETTNNGVTVTGDITPTGYIQIDDSSSGGNLYIGDGSDLKLFHNGTNSYIRSGASNAPILFDNNSGVLGAKFVPAGAFELYYNGSKKFETTSTGVKLPDNQKVELGDGSDLQIFHDGNYSYIKDTGTGGLVINTDALYIKNASDTEALAYSVQDSAVSLYFDNSKKFETTTTGAKVTGALEVTQEYPSIRPTLDLNFAATKTLDRRITFTRNSRGTYIDENRVLKYASNNVPRFDHDFDTGESLGLLIEESGTNLFTYSNFSQSTPTSRPSGWDGWNPATFLTSQTLSPDGVDYGVFHGAINQNGGGFRKDITGLVPGGTYYVTYHVKGLTSTELTYFTNNNARGTTTGTADGAQNVSWFAATQVKFECVNLNGTGASGSGQIVLTQDWQRFGGTIVADNAGSARIIISNNVSDTGTGNEDGGGTWMIWGAQLELGAFPTSYIPTSGSSVTRAVDIAKITGTNFTDFYNQTEGTILINWSTSNTARSVPYALSDGTDTNRIAVYTTPSSNLLVSYTASPAGGFDQSVGNLSFAEGKYAIGYVTGDTQPVYNGTLGTTITEVNLPTNNRLNIGVGANGTAYQFSGHISNFCYYNKRLPNAQLQGLTQQ